MNQRLGRNQDLLKHAYDMSFWNHVLVFSLPHDSRYHLPIFLMFTTQKQKVWNTQFFACFFWALFWTKDEKNLLQPLYWVKCHGPAVALCDVNAPHTSSNGASGYPRKRTWTLHTFLESSTFHLLHVYWRCYKKSFIRMFFWGFGGRFWLILPTMGWSNRYLTNRYTQIYQGHIL